MPASISDDVTASQDRLGYSVLRFFPPGSLCIGVLIYLNYVYLCTLSRRNHFVINFFYVTTVLYNILQLRNLAFGAGKGGKGKAANSAVTSKGQTVVGEVTGAGDATLPAAATPLPPGMKVHQWNEWEKQDKEVGFIC